MVTVHKTKAKGGFLYISLMDFKDEIEQDIIYKKIQELIKASQTRLKVY